MPRSKAEAVEFGHSTRRRQEAEPCRVAGAAPARSRPLSGVSLPAPDYPSVSQGLAALGKQASNSPIHRRGCRHPARFPVSAGTTGRCQERQPGQAAQLVLAPLAGRERRFCAESWQHHQRRRTHDNWQGSGIREWRRAGGGYRRSASKRMANLAGSRHGCAGLCHSLRHRQSSLPLARKRRHDGLTTG